MNEPIISPWIFYWIDVLSALDELPGVIALLGFISAMLVIPIYVEGYEKTKHLCRKITVIYLSIFALSAVISILVPSRTTMYQMLIASYVTPSNVEYIKNEVKSSTQDIVDNITNASIKIIKAEEGK